MPGPWPATAEVKGQTQVYASESVKALPKVPRATTAPAFVLTRNGAINLVHVAQAWRGTVDYITQTGKVNRLKLTLVMRGVPRADAIVTLTGADAERVWDAIEQHNAGACR